MIKIAAVLIFSLFVSNNVAAMNECNEPTNESDRTENNCLAQMPSKKILTQCFQDESLDHFIQKTSLIKELADQKMSPTLIIEKIVNACTTYSNYFARTISPTETLPQVLTIAVTGTMEPMVTKDFVDIVLSKIFVLIPELLANQPDAIDEYLKVLSTWALKGLKY